MVHKGILTCVYNDAKLNMKNFCKAIIFFLISGQFNELN